MLNYHYIRVEVMSTPLNALNDFELAAALKSGNERAFSLIYERYWDKVYVIARNRLGNKPEAEEVVQDIFCNLWRRRESLILTKAFDNYFAVAVKFEVINRLAKNARATAYERQLGVDLSEVDESTLQLINYNELQKQFQLTVSALPEKCQLVFKLQHDRGFTQQQIADELNISTKTVEAHLSKARKTLRGAFGNLLGILL